MDTSHLTEALVAELDPIARPVVAGYLRELAAALPGPGRTRDAILTEIADGLIEQITNTPGADRAIVARTAVHAFGGPLSLAVQFTRELTGKTAHRVGLSLISSGPLVGMLWLVAITGDQPYATEIALPERIEGMFTALPLVPVLLLVIISAALVAVAGAGRASRLLPVSIDTAGCAGLVAGTGCAIADGSLIWYAALTSSAWSPLLIAAVMVSSVRFSLAAAAARRCAQLRAAC